MATAVRSLAVVALLLGACRPDTERASTQACAEIAEARSQGARATEAARVALAGARAPGVEELARVGHCALAAGHLSMLGDRLRYGEGRLSGMAAMVPGHEPLTFHVVTDLGAHDVTALGKLLNTVCGAGAPHAGLEEAAARIDVVERLVDDRADAAGCPP